MVDTITFLTSITFILLAGLVSVAVSKRLKIPLPLVLFFSGVVFGNIFYYGRPLIRLGEPFLSAFSIIAFILILFDATSRIRFSEIDNSVKSAFRFFILSLIFNILIISSAAKLLFGLTVFTAVVFSLMISCIEVFVIYPRHHEPKNKVIEMIKDESAISCAFITIMPFLIIYFMQVSGLFFKTGFFAKLMGLFVSIFGGIGAGLIIALLLFKLTNTSYFENMSSFIIAAGLLFAYVLAQQIDGNGFVAVATMGVIFGNVFLRNKKLIRKHEDAAYHAIELFVFILMGVLIGLPAKIGFYRLSIILFLAYLLLRFVAASIMLKNYTVDERIEAAFFVPKGVITVVLAFALLNYTFAGIILMTQLLLAFFVYSLILDTVLDKVGFYKHR